MDLIKEISGMFFGGEKKVLLKVESSGNSLSTWCDMVELKRLPGPQKQQLKSFFGTISEEMK